MSSHTKPRRWRSATAIAALCVALTGCGGGATQPSSSTPSSSTPAPRPPRPGPNELDARLAQCPLAAELATVSDVTLVLSGGLPKAPLVCRAADGSADLTRTQERAYQALLMMKRLRFSEPLPWTDVSLYEWFTSEATGIWFSDEIEISNCCTTDRKPRIAVHGEASDLTWYSLETLISGIVHETRHLAVGPHRCGTKDLRIADKEAFGVHNYFLQWIGRHSDPAVIPLEYRPLALWKACNQANSAFCQEPPHDCSTLR